jgi:hypothetical protein
MNSKKITDPIRTTTIKGYLRKNSNMVKNEIS